MVFLIWGVPPRGARTADFVWGLSPSGEVQKTRRFASVRVFFPTFLACVAKKARGQPVPTTNARFPSTVCGIVSQFHYLNGIFRWFPAVPDHQFSHAAMARAYRRWMRLEPSKHGKDPLTGDMVLAMYEALPKPLSDFDLYRYVLLLNQYHTGGRPSDSHITSPRDKTLHPKRGIRVNDVAVEAQVVRIRFKMLKNEQNRATWKTIHRALGTPLDLGHFFKEYLARVQGNSHDYFFNNPRGTVTTGRYVTKHIRELAVLAGIDPTYLTAHSCRLGLAQDMADCGIPVDDICTAMHWKQKSSFERYARNKCSRQLRASTAVQDFLLGWC